MAEPECELLFHPIAQDCLRKLDKTVAAKLVAKVKWLAATASYARHEYLPGDLAAYCKCRSDSYRLIYWLGDDPLNIVVAFAGK